ncbi:MAG: hypothetical protein WCA04_12795 [Geobacteraceae bacterium]
MGTHNSQERYAKKTDQCQDNDDSSGTERFTRLLSTAAVGAYLSINRYIPTTDATIFE